MSTQYRCKNQARRNLVEKSSAINGIDYLDVSVDELTLVVHFLHPLPGQPGGIPANPPLTANNVAILGGTRVKNIQVQTVSSSGNALTVTVSSAGDFSNYTLSLVAGTNSDSPPNGFDVQLSSIDFSFKVNCDSDFDCAPVQICPVEQDVEPFIDYLSRDYNSFRGLMLDRLAITLPEWQERNPADIGIAIVEAIAYTADHQSYYQDAVATEAYLGTARKRVSVRRHARMLDYPMHEGCNSRAWVRFVLDTTNPKNPGVEGQLVPKGSQLLTRLEAPRGGITALDASTLSGNALGFETLHDLALFTAHNDIAFYTWHDDQCCLPRGATRATLKEATANAIKLAVGDVLIFQEKRGPVTGLEADADPSHRQAVRLTNIGHKVDTLTGDFIVDIEWSAEDALHFPLCLSELINGNPVSDISVAHGNVLLADEGMRLTGETLTPSSVPDTGAYQPTLQRSDITFRHVYDHAVAISQPAGRAMGQDPRTALPDVQLKNLLNETWSPQLDLLHSDRFAPEFVVEMDENRLAHIRFGEGVYGKIPSPGDQFTAGYRIGNGKSGNVGSDSIAHLVTNMPGIVDVRNPLPAVGGENPESTAQVKLYAPQAFRTQERAVTEADYAEVTIRHPQVQKAVATRRWTGSWHTMFVTVDRKGGLSVTPDFAAEIRAFLERYRMAGLDLEIESPIYVPLDIAMTVCVAPGYFKSAVRKALTETFSSYDLPDGRRGFFHPDNFTFAQPVYLSQIISAAMKVPGVHWVDLGMTISDFRFPNSNGNQQSTIDNRQSSFNNRFQRLGQISHNEQEIGEISMGRLEIARLDNDPNEPENGKIEFFMEGGL